MDRVRLDKLLAGTGLFSRSEGKKKILSGSVMVDGHTVCLPETKVSRCSAVLVEGESVDTAEHVVYMMNKPPQTICATKDGTWPAVTNLLPPFLQARGLFPVGRLDADVTGLLLLTDDGAFAHKVTSPRYCIPKTYEIETDLPMEEEDAVRLSRGIKFREEISYRPAKLAIDPDSARRGTVTVTEGKYHEVKNLLAFCGKKILSMRRICMGSLHLDEGLPLGAVRRLSEEEAAEVLQF